MTICHGTARLPCSDQPLPKWSELSLGLADYLVHAADDQKKMPRECRTMTSKADFTAMDKLQPEMWFGSVVSVWF